MDKKNEKEKYILEKAAKFAVYENPNNFDEYHIKIMTKLSEKNNFKEIINAKFVTDKPLKIKSKENNQYDSENKKNSLFKFI